MSIILLTLGLALILNGFCIMAMVVKNFLLFFKSFFKKKTELDDDHIEQKNKHIEEYLEFEKELNSILED